MSSGSLAHALILAGIALVAGCGQSPRSAAPAPAPAAALAMQVPPSARPSSRATSIRILVGGDLLPHRPALESPASIARALAPLSALFGTADATVANYETSTGDARFFGAGKNMSLAASPEWMAEVARAKINALTVANNHACDLGKSGFEETLRTARSLDLVALGGDTVDPWRAQVLQEKEGHRICAVAWTTLVNGGGSCRRSGEIAMAGFDRKGTARIERAILAARKDGCDAVVAILHGGREYAPQIWGPLSQARRAAEAGADAVVIHHPHVPSAIDVVTTPDGRRVPVFGSVGNLVSNQGESWQPTFPPQSRERLISRNAWTRLGVLADFEWSWPAQPEGGPKARSALTWGYHLVWTENDHAAHKNDPLPDIEVRPVDPSADRVLIDKLATDEQGPKGLLFGDCWIEATKKRCDASLSAGKDQPIF